MAIGLFYGSTTCYTEMAAEKIQNALGGPEIVELHNVKDTSLTEMEHYDILILGISTWDYGELQEDWDAVWNDLDTLKLDGKIVALFGLGDQEGYGEWFLDAMGMLYAKLAMHQVSFIGYWPNQGYQFDTSKALTQDGDYFVGLALDDETQYEQSDTRIEQWTNQLLEELQAISE
ncbi:flavodoxin FldB [Celerinatantimonas sp. YJH-8]|uniref:flavodoxin FldB n=1 Tax=Celerinatantimonas sp. YJH-8 TaxID=3228714 RepID=UPI0038C67F20